MTISALQEEDKLVFTCKGKIKNQTGLLKIKKIVFANIKNNPSIRNLSFKLEAFPIDLSLLGFLLTLSNLHLLQIEILVSSYSNYRMLEDLCLLQKFQVKYLKEH